MILVAGAILFLALAILFKDEMRAWIKWTLAYAFMSGAWYYISQEFGFGGWFASWGWVVIALPIYLWYHLRKDWEKMKKEAGISGSAWPILRQRLFPSGQDQPQQTIEQRMARLKQRWEHGLITDEEYYETLNRLQMHAKLGARHGAE